MCGIVGIISKQPVRERLVEGLRSLEYRGYDSAGVAIINESKIERCRASGKLVELESALKQTPIDGTIGIAHTRWATHGGPTKENAHPHCSKQVAVVHNGIIENYTELKAVLEKQGVEFTSETDTEVIPHLIEAQLAKGKSIRDAIAATMEQLDGAYALAVICSRDSETVYVARHGSPLVVGTGDKGSYVASDALALAPHTEEVTYLEEGDIAALKTDGILIWNKDLKQVHREAHPHSELIENNGKAEFDHFMLKEIYEQPSVAQRVIDAYITQGHAIELPDIGENLNDISGMAIVACGTSFYAGNVAKYWMESLARVPVQVDIASEFRYRRPVLPKKGVAVFISQSGETADTLAALRHAKEQGQTIIAIVNTEGSTMAREADIVLPMHAGPEIGVASTKAFIASLVVLASLSIVLARQTGKLNEAEEKRYTLMLTNLPGLLQEALAHDNAMQEVAKHISEVSDILYIGRGLSYAVAMEGALKLKEISYINAQAIAAGELKHGTIAIIDENVPVVAIAPTDDLFPKTASNIQEVKARDGKIVLLSDRQGVKSLKDVTDHAIELPQVDDILAPMIYALPVQLLAYHVAVLKGTDVDQPRNLAKSVTVE